MLRRLFSLALASAFLLPLSGFSAVVSATQPACNGGQYAHSTFLPLYREPQGAVAAGSGSIRLQFQSCGAAARSALSVSLHIADMKSGSRNVIRMRRVGAELWRASVQIPADPTLLSYFFEVNDGRSSVFYGQASPGFQTELFGRLTLKRESVAPYQVTVYDPGFSVPSWYRGRVVYQILPDRFRNGDRTNDPVSGVGQVFGNPIQMNPWAQPLCDPRTSECFNQSDNQFYGGDLQGIIDRLDYLRELGVSALYLNPIFRSSTNHRYDTQDYFTIDPELGNLRTFETLVSESRKRGIGLILDGVFNHVSSDSAYFDIYSRWQGVGACESPFSPYRDWFTFPHRTQVPRDYRTGLAWNCAGEDRSRVTYESWWGCFELPVLNVKTPEVRSYFFDSDKGVGPYWLRRGASGWRMDVASEIAPGEANPGAEDTYWQEFRAAVKSANPEAVIIGEEWNDASSWLLGHQWDSVMNYPFRTALLNWLFDECQGRGCHGKAFHGQSFEDDDNNELSGAGPLRPLSESAFHARLLGIAERYPWPVQLGLMNLLGSHDTNRVLFLLKKISGEDRAAARAKLKLAALFQFTYPGSPAIFYGDEVGVAAAGKWHDNRWKDDPHSRAVYPWAEEGMRPDEELRGYFARLAALRAEHKVLREGLFEAVEIDDKRRIFAFRRFLPREGVEAWVVLNRGLRSQKIKLPIPLRKRQARELLSQERQNIAGDLGFFPPLSGKVFLIER